MLNCDHSDRLPPLQYKRYFVCYIESSGLVVVPPTRHTIKRHLLLVLHMHPPPPCYQLHVSIRDSLLRSRQIERRSLASPVSTAQSNNAATAWRQSEGGHGTDFKTLPCAHWATSSKISVCWRHVPASMVLGPRSCPKLREWLLLLKVQLLKNSALAILAWTSSWCLASRQHPLFPLAPTPDRETFACIFCPFCLHPVVTPRSKRVEAIRGRARH
jgi:hypothetical protein